MGILDRAAAARLNYAVALRQAAFRSAVAALLILFDHLLVGDLVFSMIPGTHFIFLGHLS
jgi:hypothetical protein